MVLPMYLARMRVRQKTRYVIRESYLHSNHYKSRDLFDLGSDPTRFIHYPGGNSYYLDPAVEDELTAKGVDVDPYELDRLFYDFLRPETRRLIDGFDRRYRQQGDRKAHAAKTTTPLHLFDKRRYHYLRFGHSTQRHIGNVADKIFSPLQAKSRDELEHYFASQEQRLRPHERRPYLATIFELSAFIPTPDSDTAIQEQLDLFFMDRLCRLNDDAGFTAGTIHAEGPLFEHLVKYAVLYFDTDPADCDPTQRYIRDFIRRHRVYRPPQKVRIQIRRAEKLFGSPWKELKAMSRSELTRRFRKLALKHHPDQGGDAGTFREMVQYFKALLSKKLRK